jgi:hydrogenase maturation protein HypF
MQKSIARIRVSGMVQGVGFRPFVYRTAREFGLNGYVRNLGDAGVEMEVEGERKTLLEFTNILNEEKPPNARIKKIDVVWKKSEGRYGSFIIAESGGSGSTGIIPPDIAICDECISEILNPGERRYLYPFTSCVNCGPRFTTITALPYDRINTAFGEFPPCEECEDEYQNPDNRRFHAQTIACPRCGPGYSLFDNDGKILFDGKDAVTEGTKLLEDGIVAIKGLGGIHIAAGTTDDTILKKLRKKLGRREQPFAVMAPSVPSIKEFATVSDAEEKAMKSFRKPIAVLEKSKDYYLSDLVSSLHNVGVMLPYTGIHRLIFEHMREPLVMTSANFSGEPMLVDNESALRELKEVVDYFLLHDLRIANRCDDSVLRGKNSIRLSRGFVPFSIDIPFRSKKRVLALGPELNVSVCLLRESRAFLSQYVGDTSKIDTLNYLKNSAEHLLGITGTGDVDILACDLHPGFNTTRIAEDLGRKHGTEPIRVQHHHAHIASLMAENSVDEMVGIAVDGVGYGTDGNIWGGEILLTSYIGFDRPGHIMEFKMPGGDLATKYPARVVAGILHGILDADELEEVLMENCIDGFRHGWGEVGIVLKQLEKNLNVFTTTSCGRVLDAASSLLGICHERTYEGEPAMKLESVAHHGKERMEIPAYVENRDGRYILNAGKILLDVLNLKGKGSVADIASAAQRAIAKGFAEIAITVAEENGIGDIGISGGVAYNEQICSTIRQEVENSGCRFLTHVRVPCGDGGVSLGQSVVAAMKSKA